MMYEMYFDNLETYRAAMASEENKAAGKDLLSFAGDLVTMMIADAYEDELRH